ncbi:MAG: response regulator transcription factor [Chitinophagaceae bacterium]|nr:response regulator transcription factor [Chitinophagaceae bacterium]
MANLALIDDHLLMRNGLSGLISKLGHRVILEAGNGAEMIDRLNPAQLPEIVLLDVSMPVMNGYETARWLTEHYPEIRILALSMQVQEGAIIRMIKAGARGYLLKDADPQQLQEAIHEVLSKGFYFSDLVNGKLIHAISSPDEKMKVLNILDSLSERELSFLKYACSELTYKEIADKMCISPRTVDGYRDSLFEKLQIRTRVGLALFAIKNEIVSFD